jgi:TRAP-type C4-dicarboxylate transport system permease small subunit
MARVTTSRAALKPLAAVLAAIDRLAEGGLIALMVVMIAVVSVQVVLRYVFNGSIGWADETSRLAFVWSVFLAIPICAREGLHVGVELLTSRLPAGAQEGLVRVMALGSSGLMLMVAYQAAIIARDQWDETMASVPISSAWFVVAVGVGVAHTALHMLWIALNGKPGQSELVSAE